jgi:hypothetical protein
LHAAVDVHLYRTRADEQGAAGLPAGVSLGYQLHDVQFAVAEACGHAARVWVAAWCVAELAEPGGAAFAQVTGAELVGGGVRGVQQLPCAGVLAEPGGSSGGAALGLGCLQREIQAAEHLGCRAQLVCGCFRLVCQQGLAAGVREGGNRFGLGSGLGYLR